MAELRPRFDARPSRRPDVFSNAHEPYRNLNRASPETPEQCFASLNSTIACSLRLRSALQPLPTPPPHGRELETRLRETMPPPEPVPDLSIFLIAKDEADRIGATIAAVRALSDDIVVVDSGSTDGTQQVAEAAGARVIHHDWPGYGPQKRFAEEQCRHLWLLNLDADEVVPPDLAVEIRRALTDGALGIDGFRLRIAEVFPGEGAPHSFAYALTPVRLYRRDKGRYADALVHDRVAFAPGSRFATLKGTVHHFSVRSLGDQIAKLNGYTDQQVADLAKKGEHVPTWRLFAEFPAAFFKAYVIRRHALRGVYGFMTAMNFAFYRWLRVAKDVERRRRDADRGRSGGPRAP
jgi:glycosyltransferase involved in cell wall biosynthesis